MRLLNRRVLGSTVLALGSVLVLAGCGAGQITQTDSQEPAVNGALAQVKTISIRNAALEYPPSGVAYAAHSSASLSLSIINSGPQDDELVSASSDAAAGAVVSGSKLVVAGASLVIAPAEGGAADVPSSAAKTTAPETTTSSPKTSTSESDQSESDQSTTKPTAPTSAEPKVEPGKATVVLQDLKQPVWPGQLVKVTLVFRDAGAITVELPVAAPTHGRPGEVHTEAATPEGH